MRALIQADLFKIRKSSLIKILLLLSVISAIMMYLAANLLAKGDLTLANGVQLASFFSDPQMISLLGCVTAGVFITSDFENKAIEHAISSGKGRLSIVSSKMTALALILLWLMLPYFVFNVACQLLDQEFLAFLQTPLLHLAAQSSSLSASDAGKLVLIFLTILLQTIAQLSITLPIIFLLRKPVLVMAVSYFLQLLLGPLASLNQQTKAIMSYTPFGLDGTKLTMTAKSAVFVEYMGISLLFILFMIIIAYLIFRKAEVK